MDNQTKVIGGVFGLASLVGCAVSLWQLVANTQNPIWFGSLLVFVVVTGFAGHYLWVRGLNSNHETQVKSLNLIIEEKNQSIEQVLEDAEQALSELFEQAGTWFHWTTHEIRNRTTALDWLKLNDKVSLSYLRQDAEDTSRNIANYVEELFSYYLLETIAVSVKIIRKDENGEEEVITLCRSQHSAQGRKIGDKHTVGPKNTAFFEIRTGLRTYYGKPDLIAEHLAGRYSNTNPQWQQQYKSAIVVPIRKKNPNYPETSTEEFVLIGFLCADANAVDVFRDDMMDAYAHMMMAAADGLYKYLETVTDMQKEDV
jgi:hypothetical protein